MLATSCYTDERHVHPFSSFRCSTTSAPGPKSASPAMLSLVLSELSSESPPTPPYLTTAIYIYKELGGLESKSRWLEYILAYKKVNFSWRV
jgi:hypothetical protein